MCGVSRSISVTMYDIKLFVFDLKLNGLARNGGTEFFLVVIKHPEVMVSWKKIEFNPRISKFSKFPLKANESFGNGVFVLEPKIKDITNQENSMSIGFDGVKPLYQKFFTLRACGMVRNAKVKIRCEVNLLSLGKMNGDGIHANAKKH